MKKRRKPSFITSYIETRKRVSSLSLQAKTCGVCVGGVRQRITRQEKDILDEICSGEIVIV
jgi:hypothetical protein